MQTIRALFQFLAGLNLPYRQPTGPIETTQCDFETMESVTDTLYNELHSLVETPFFKYFRVSTVRSCLSS